MVVFQPTYNWYIGGPLCGGNEWGNMRPARVSAHLGEQCSREPAFLPFTCPAAVDWRISEETTTKPVGMKTMGFLQTLHVVI